MTRVEEAFKNCQVQFEKAGRLVYVWWSLSFHIPLLISMPKNVETKNKIREVFLILQEKVTYCIHIYM